jgi:long-chain fatty acid transport protein
MSTARNRTILALGVSLALAAGSASATNGYFTAGVGTKSKAQAGAGSANPEETLTLATNPAGIAFVPESVDVGVGVFSPLRDYKTGPSQLNGNCFTPPGASRPFCPFTIGPNNESSENEYFIVPYIAANWALSDHDFVALAFYGRGGMNTTWTGGTATFDPDGPLGPSGPVTFRGTYGGGASVNPAGIPGGDGEAGVDLMQGFLNLSYAAKVSDRFSVGASGILAIQRFQARGVNKFAPYTQTFAASGGTVLPTNLSGNGHNMSYGFGMTFGVQWNPIDMFSVAAAYTTKMTMSKFSDYKDLFAEQGGFDIPSTGTIGVAFKPTDSLAFMFDLQEIWYSDVDSVANPIQNLFACPTAGQGGTALQNCLGGNNGGGFGWDNMTIYKFGASWRMNDQWTFRGGYSFADQPIPDDQMTFNILAPGVMEQHWTLGLTNTLSSGNEWSASFMYAPENTISGPNNFDPTQRVDLSMQQFELEFSYSWR